MFVQKSIDPVLTVDYSEMYSGVVLFEIYSQEHQKCLLTCDHLTTRGEVVVV